MLTTRFSPAAAEQALNDWGIAFVTKPDGTIFVPGDIDLSHKSLTELPDFAAVTVGGSFTCAHNALTSLEGAPRAVEGPFYCFANQLETMKGGPETVGGEFSCINNKLVSLEHAPRSVGGGFFCFSNSLASLEHAPEVFEKIVSNLGDFASWDEIPAALAPEGKARHRQKKTAKIEAAVRDMITVKAPVAVRTPFRFKI